MTPLAEAISKTNPTTAFVLAAWQTPIEFYGKVVDENSNAVAAAKISFHWVEFPAEDGNRNTNTESDVEGLFSLRGQRGPDLSVSVSKEGYYAAHRGEQGFKYGPFGNPDFSPNPQNPVIFTLRKKGKGEPLIQSEFPPGMGQIAQLRGDGTPAEIDLFNSQKVSEGNGQLRLELFRGQAEKTSPRFDWKCRLSVPGGGLVETDQEFAFEAPQTGYEASLVIDMPATNQTWCDDLTRKYYVQLPGGRYGRIDFYLLADNGVFTIKSAINPNGSRNLEPTEMPPTNPQPLPDLPPGAKAVIPVFR
jgi:hypothetical protein